MRKLTILMTVLALLLIASATALGQSADSAFLRVGNFSVDAGAVDVYIDDDLAASGLAFPDMTGWVELPAGSASVTVTSAGGSMDEALLDPIAYDLSAGDWITVALIGDVEHGTLGAQVLMEDYSDIGAGETRLSAFHAIVDGPPLNVMANDTELVRLLGYPGFFGPESDGFTVSDIIAQPYQVTLTLEDGTTFLDLGELTLGEQRNYFVAAVGLQANPTFVVVATDPTDLSVAETSMAEEDLGEGNMHARVAHLAPGVGDVDVYIKDELTESELAFPGISDWMELSAGVYHVVIVPVGESMDSAVVEADVPLATDTRVTIAVIGSIELDTLTIQPLVEDFSTIGAGETRLSVFHAIPDAMTLSVVVNGNVLIQSLGYPGFFGPDSDGFSTRDLVAGTHSVEITQADGVVAVDAGQLVMGEGRNYFVALTGLLNNPLYVVEVTEP